MFTSFNLSIASEQSRQFEAVQWCSWQLSACLQAVARQATKGRNGPFNGFFIFQSVEMCFFPFPFLLRLMDGQFSDVQGVFSLAIAATLDTFGIRGWIGYT